MSTIELSDEVKRAIALAIHNDVDFFVHDGIAYEGTWEDNAAAYAEWLQHNDLTDTNDNRREWIEQECIPLEADNDRYLVLTDSEAEDACCEQIEDRLWAFNPSFLSSVSSIDQSVFEAIAANNKYESNNQAIRSIIDATCGMDSIVNAATNANGRGYFLASYDGHEHEVNLFDYTGKNDYLYLYRVN